MHGPRPRSACRGSPRHSSHCHSLHVLQTLLAHRESVPARACGPGPPAWRTRHDTRGVRSVHAPRAPWRIARTQTHPHLTAARPSASPLRHLYCSSRPTYIMPPTASRAYRGAAPTLPAAPPREAPRAGSASLSRAGPRPRPASLVCVLRTALCWATPLAVAHTVACSSRAATPHSPACPEPRMHSVRRLGCKAEQPLRTAARVYKAELHHEFGARGTGRLGEGRATAWQAGCGAGQGECGTGARVARWAGPAGGVLVARRGRGARRDCANRQRGGRMGWV